MLTRKQLELLVFLDRRLGETGVCPSFDEMKEALGLRSKSGIHRLITGLEERGFIRRLAHRARALEVLKLPDDRAREPALPPAGSCKRASAPPARSQHAKIDRSQAAIGPQARRAGDAKGDSRRRRLPAPHRQKGNSRRSRTLSKLCPRARSTPIRRASAWRQ